MEVPKNPPRFPTLLISAMAPAAAASVKKDGGIDQNGEYAPNAPQRAIVKKTNDKTILVFVTKLLMIIAMALVVKQTATCQRRSFFLSEWFPTRIIVTIAQTYINPKTQPIDRVLRDVASVKPFE